MAAANGDSATNGDDGVSQTEPDSNSPASDQQTDQQPNQPISGKQRSVSTLRWWPGLLLLLAMPLLRAIPSMMDSPSLPVMMMGFMGPIAVGALLLVWWCFASRASIKEKTLGTIAFVAIAVIAVGLLHVSLEGMGAIIMVIPTGFFAFGVGLVVMSRSPRLRVPVALLLTLMAFGYWDLRQSEGVTGKFKSQLLWRWEPTAEEKYLNELASRRNSEQPGATSTPVTLESAQWPAFRGADRSGVVTGVTLSEDWETNPPTLIWKQKIGPGWSSFTVAGKRIYTQEQRGDEEAVICLDGNTGNPLWETTYPSRFWEAIGGAGPRATPTIADEGLFALGADGILLRLDAVDGTEFWRRDLKQDAGRKPPIWGFASSPLVTDSLVIVHAGGKDDKGIFAYDTETGDIAWSVPSGNHSYSSAQLATFADQRGILMIANDGLQFLNVADGQTIWRHDWPFENYRIIQPLVVDQSVYLATSLQEGTRRLSVSCGQDDSWEVTEDWTTRAMKPDFNDYVHYQGNIYGFDGSVFACVDAATGDRQWKRGRYGNGQVILLADAGQLLVATEKGEIALIDASPDKLVELAKFQAIEGKTWNHPVLIGDRLYIRNAQEAACYQLSLR